MQINNPLQINDWEIMRFLKVVLAIQLAVWGVIGLDAIGLQIPVIRQLIGFVYLAFIPGVIVLKILKLHKLGTIETLLYSVGLSIATLMLTGLFMNTVYPFFGISQPISIIPLLITISVVVLILCVVSYVSDKDFSALNYMDIREVLSPPALFICLLPFLSIFGTYLVNFYHNNILLMFLIVMIALVALLIGFDKFIHGNLYPLAIFAIALSLVFHRSLISMYISGYDIHHEYQLANLVITNAIWDSTIPVGYNAMLSVTMLAPISSNICNMSLTWVFKIIYPLLLSLVPLGLYRVFQKQTDDKIAFFACFFFVSAFPFYTDLPVMLRQSIATLFLVLLILLMIDKGMSRIHRSILSVVFGFSLVVSHYGLSYIYMFCLISAWLILFLAENPVVQKLKNTFCVKFSRVKTVKLGGNPNSLRIGDRTVSSTFVMLFGAFALTWYMYVSSSSVFDSFVYFGNHIVSSIGIDIGSISPEQAYSALLAQTKLDQLLQVVRLITNRLAQIFIVMGVLVLLFKHRELKFEKEYAAFSVVNLVIYLLSIPPPFSLPPFYLASVDVGRLHLISLIFLAPFCVIGGITVFRMISRVVKISWTNKSMRRGVTLLSVFFVIFFLYQTGFVWEVTGRYSGSISLGQEWTEKYGVLEMKVTLYNVLTLEQDVLGARWLSMNMKSGEKIYATHDDIRVHALTSYGMIPIEDVLQLTETTKTIPKDAYVNLQYLNVVEGIGQEFDPAPIYERQHNIYDMTDISHLFAKKNKIYSNGGSEIYK